MSKENNLSQSGLLVIQLLKDKRLKKDDLTPRQRKLVVKYFTEEASEFSNQNIADMIGVTDVRVGQIRQQLLKSAVWEIETIDIKMLATGLLQKKKQFQRRAVERNDFSLAWQIEKDYIEKMQSLGFVYKAPEKMDLVTKQSDFERQLEEFLNAFGVPDVGEFIARLSNGGPGNGDGKGRLLLEAGDKPVRSKKDGRRDPQDRSTN